MRIIALDVGQKRIGVAVSDPMGIVAQAVKVVIIKDEAAAIAELAALIKERDAQEIVVGLPLNMNGTESLMTKDVIRFADKLKEAVAVPVKMWDERLTSLQIERDLIFLDVSRAKRKKINDMLAAQIILQNYLDAQKKGDNGV